MNNAFLSFDTLEKWKVPQWIRVTSYPESLTTVWTVQTPCHVQNHSQFATYSPTAHFRDQLMFLSCFIHQTQPRTHESHSTKLGSNSTCRQIDRNTSPCLHLWLQCLKTVFTGAIKAAALFGGMYRQILKADTQIRLWMCKIDTVVVTKHNRKLLWGAEGFDCLLSQSKRWPESPSNRWLGLC